MWRNSADRIRPADREASDPASAVVRKMTNEREEEHAGHLFLLEQNSGYRCDWIRAYHIMYSFVRVKFLK